MVSLVHGRVLGGSPLSLKGQPPHSRGSSYLRLALTPVWLWGSSEREREKGRHPSSLRRGPGHPAARFARINTRHPIQSPSHPLFACAACLCLLACQNLPTLSVQVSGEFEWLPKSVITEMLSNHRTAARGFVDSTIIRCVTLTASDQYMIDHRVYARYV